MIVSFVEPEVAEWKERRAGAKQAGMTLPLGDSHDQRQGPFSKVVKITCEMTRKIEIGSQWRVWMYL